MLFRLSVVILSGVNLSVVNLSGIVLSVVVLNLGMLSVVLSLREVPHRSHAWKCLGKMGEQFTIAKSFVVAAPNLAKVAETIKKISERESQFSKSGTLHRWTDGEEM
jgi:hypothetical protein